MMLSACIRSFVLSILCVLLLGSPLMATEGGGGTYPNGAEGIMTGALPPAGFYYLNYLTHYSAHALKDADGDDLPVDFDLNVTANVSRFVYMTQKNILGGTYGVYLNLPLVNASATLDTPEVSLSHTTSGLGDISFAPLLIGWHSKNYHSGLALEFTAPTGAYDADQLVNLGRNYWNIELVYAATFLANNGFELSGKFMYDYNFENSDTNYQSGQEFHCDYAAAYHHGPFSFGVAGYYYQQLTDDEGDGVSDDDGYKGRVFAAGPTMKYDYRNMSLEARYQKEMLVENRSEGEKLWLKLVWAF